MTGAVVSEKRRRPGWQTGWIVGPIPDVAFFVLLPAVAVLAAAGCHHWLPYVALASVNLWVTIPHHCATWVRTYGLSEDWQRWKTRLLAGPVVIVSVALLGHEFAPATLLLVVTMWDHQHSIMQQHGFARIFDFKAGAGARTSARWDLAVNWTLYGNLFLTAPLFVQYWVRELFQWRLAVDVESIRWLQGGSWTVTALVLAGYSWHLRGCLTHGHGVNPMKLVFLVASYGLWYTTAWHTDSILVFGIAHRLMHGLQYMVIVKLYLDRKGGGGQSGGPTGRWLGLTLAGRRGLWRFVGISLVYALVFQLVVGQPRPLETFGFGVVDLGRVYDAIPELGVGRFSERALYELFATAMVDAVAMVHYYFDSFIWKVSDRQVQEGL